jgi:hypothetical protein
MSPSQNTCSRYTALLIAPRLKEAQERNGKTSDHLSAQEPVASSNLPSFRPWNGRVQSNVPIFNIATIVVPASSKMEPHGSVQPYLQPLYIDRWAYSGPPQRAWMYTRAPTPRQSHATYVHRQGLHWLDNSKCSFPFVTDYYEEQVVMPYTRNRLLTANFLPCRDSPVLPSYLPTQNPKVHLH